MIGQSLLMPNKIQEVTFYPLGDKKEIFFLKNYTSITRNSLIFLLCYYTPLEEDVTLYFNVFESPLPKDTLCQVWLKLAKWVLSKRFLKVLNVCSLCGYYLPLEKCMVFKLNKFEFPLLKNTLCHVWLKLTKRFRRRFLKVVNLFSVCCYYLPLEKEQDPSFERNLIPLTQGCSVPGLVEIGPLVLHRRSSMYVHNVAIIIYFDKGHGPSCEQT